MRIQTGTRLWFFGLLSLALLFSSIFGCGGSNSSVGSQGLTQGSQLSLKATISSSVAEGVGKTSCQITCEYTLTAGINQTTKAQRTFSALEFICDDNGVPVTGQGFEAMIALDSNDREILEGITLTGNCGPSGSNFIDTITEGFLTNSGGFFTGSVDLDAQNCFQDATQCSIELMLTSIKDQINNESGLPGLVSTLKCPTFNFLGLNDCTQDTALCDTLKFLGELLGCSPGACGNGKLDKGEICGEFLILPSCPPSFTCENCKCVGPPEGFCGDGIVNGQELCDIAGGEANNCQLGACDSFICRCCGDGVCDLGLGENEGGCPDDCGPKPENCSNLIDDDGDGLIDCEDIEGCCFDTACDGNLLCCGDNNVQFWEDCDDGNAQNGDGCTDTCHTICGDNLVVGPREQCDIGSSENGDALCRQIVDELFTSGTPFCDSDCRCKNYCGDGACDSGSGETAMNCYADCHNCNDGICDTQCKDEFCNPIDDPNDPSCSDCKGANSPPGTCDNFLPGNPCDPGETIHNCYLNCRTCGDGVCDTNMNENKNSCPLDCF